MYADIIALTRIPLSRPQTYTYRADGFEAALRVGQAVTVPLYNRQATGIVTALHDRPPQAGIAYKPITAISDPVPLLSPADVATVRETADYYYTSAGILLKHVLPAIPKRQTKKLTAGLATLPLDAITQSPSPTVTASVGAAMGTLADRQTAYRAAIANALAADTQVLFLLPSVILFPQTLRWLQEAFPDVPIRTLAPDRSKTDELLDWRALQSGAARIALGTRRAIFSSFHTLGLIIVDEEDDVSYKQWDMNPRYHAPTVAAIKARHENCALIFGAAAPSVKTWVRIKQEKYRLLSTIPSRSETGIQLVDLRAAVRAKNYSCISYELEQALAQTLAAGKQALLFANRHGSSTFVLCRDCGYVIRCPQCGVALVEYADAHLRCPHCTFQTPAPAACPQCSSPQIKGFGTGVEKAEHEIKQRFPAARISRWDYKSTPKLKDVTRHYEESLAADIILTAPAAVRLHLPRLALAAALDADAALHVPAWHAAERGWTLLQTLVQRPDTAIILQTYNPEHPVLLRLQQNDAAGFYTAELKERRAFRYPPFVQMATLICRHDDKRMLDGEVNRVLKQLYDAVPANAVIGPLEPLTPKIRGFWYRHLLLKLAFSDNSAKLGNILKNLSNCWSIDVDPMT